MNMEIQEAFFKDHQVRFSEETIRSYRISLSQFFSFCPKSYDCVRATDVRAWLASMEEKEQKPRTINLKLTALKSFYRYCLEENKINKNPTLTVSTAKIDDSLPYYLSRREVALLQELTREDVRDRAIVETLYSTGVRISELFNIQLDDVKWETRQIWIRKGKGNKERFVLFSHDCAVRLNLYLHQRKVKSIFLFCNQRGERLSINFAEKKFQAFSSTLGFKVMPHTMRHTFAAHLAEKNMPQREFIRG